MSREDFLAERRIAVLQTEDPDGAAYLTAIWFAYVDGAFLVPTAATSRKARNARERPRGAILVDSRGPAFRGDMRAARSMDRPTQSATRRKAASSKLRA